MKTIALFLHQPKCSVQSTNGILRALGREYRFKIFTRHELEDSFFDDVDVVAVPGGVGDSDSYDYLMRIHAQSIRNFVASGGYYLGICMGAYWADTDYLGLLNDVRVTQYIKHPTACTRRPHAKHMPVYWNYERTNMYFYDGCTFAGSNFSTVARYSNLAPMAIMQDRIGLIGCHPEAEQHWYDDYTWMAPRWAGGNHFLLLDFVNNLLQR